MVWTIICDNCGEHVSRDNPAAKLGGDPRNPLSELRIRCPRCGEQSLTGYGPAVTFPNNVRLVRTNDTEAV